MSEHMSSLQKIRLENLVDLLKNPKVGNNVIAELARKIGKNPAQTRFYLNPDEKWGRKMGEEFAREVEERLGLSAFWMDKAHEHETADNIEKAEFTQDPFGQKNRHIARNLFLCSEYCNKIGTAGETQIANIVIEKDLLVSMRCFLLELDADKFDAFAEGSLLLVDPDATPDKGDVVIISFKEETPTLARYLPGFGELQIEPLERGYPASIPLKDKDYKTHGVIIWVQPKGFRP